MRAKDNVAFVSEKYAPLWVPSHAMMQAWADYLDGLKNGEDMVKKYGGHT